MPNLLQLFNTAFKNYSTQQERTHYTMSKMPGHPIYTFGWFSRLRHSRKEYPALLSLRRTLEANSPDQEKSMAVIKEHFSSKDSRWDNHSFNNYLLDEIHKYCTPDDWTTTWNKYEKKPIEFFKGIVFRGTTASPKKIFSQGFVEATHSNSISDYVTDMSGAVGVSTTKSFNVAKSYALPQNMAYRRDYAEVWTESYIYVIDYQGDSGIDLTATLRSQGRKFAAELANNKVEVNVIGNIQSKDIVGAFYVNRQDEIIWHANTRYKGNGELSQIPESFKQAMHVKTAAPRIKL